MQKQPIDTFLRKLRDLGYHAERDGELITMDCPSPEDIKKALYSPEESNEEPFLFNFDVVEAVMEELKVTRKEAEEVIKLDIALKT